jgi:hypothetical protein
MSGEGSIADTSVVSEQRLLPAVQRQLVFCLQAAKTCEPSHEKICQHFGESEALMAALPPAAQPQNTDVASRRQSVTCEPLSLSQAHKRSRSDSSEQQVDDVNKTQDALALQLQEQVDALQREKAEQAEQVSW